MSSSPFALLYPDGGRLSSCLFFTGISIRIIVSRFEQNCKTRYYYAEYSINCFTTFTIVTHS